MQHKLPGSTLQVKDRVPEAAETLLSALFAGGDLMLSQVSHISGLEPHVIQNWVARGFVSPPRMKRYSRRQLSRIMIIHMLKSVLQLDEICRLLAYINGHLDDERDDIVDDAKLYMYLLRLIFSDEAPDYEALLEDYSEPFPGAKTRVAQVLGIMVTAYASAELKEQAAALIAGLDEM